jgi:hypothetical protein
MSIAELIMTGTKRASDSTAWVGDSLAKLGQNVGQALAQKEQQKQAQAMLPFLQQSMQESMSLAGSGKTGEAYAKLMPFLTDPSVAQNPFMMPALEAGIKMNQVAADDFLRQSQIQAYKDRYAGGGTGGGGGFDVGGFVDTLNQEGNVTQDAEVIVDQTEVNPMVAGQLPGMRIPAPQNQAGMAMTRDEIDQQAVAGLPVMPQGPTKEAAQAMGGVLPEMQKEPPPKNILEKFTKIEDRFAKLPLDKQRAEMDNTSIIFPNREDIAAYKPSKGRGIIELSTAAGIGVPGAVAVELPQAVSKYVLSGVNVNPKTGNVSYSINQKEIDKDPNAKSAISWLRDWQEASVKVSNNPQLRNLLAQANNDALAIDIAPVKVDTISGAMAAKQDNYDLSVKGKPESKITVSKDVADQITMLQTQTAASNTHNAKFIRLKTEAPQAPAQPTKRKVEVLTDNGGRYYLNAKGQKVYIK